MAPSAPLKTTIKPLPPPPRAEPARLSLSPYEALHVEVASQIDQMVRDVEDILLPKRRLKQRSGYPSGSSISLARTMRFEARPQEYNKLWSRKTLSDRRETAFSLLVDLSGSMRNQKIAAAQRGIVILAETLARLSVPFAVNGFQDQLIPVCEFGEGLSAKARQIILELPQEVSGTRPNGHNQYAFNDDGPCLEAAAQDLLDYPATERVLIVVSDGLPEGRHSNKQDLRRIIQDIAATSPPVRLIGVGIGEDTEHVDHFYTTSFSNIPVSQFAE